MVNKETSGTWETAVDEKQVRNRQQPSTAVANKVKKEGKLRSRKNKRNVENLG
jgi:hypothetical protein